MRCSFLFKGVLKRCSKFTGNTHSCRSVISIKLLCNFIEIELRHGCSPVNLLHIFRTSFPRNTSGWLPLTKKVKTTKDITYKKSTFWLVERSAKLVLHCSHWFLLFFLFLRSGKYRIHWHSISEVGKYRNLLIKIN